MFPLETRACNAATSLSSFPQWNHPRKIFFKSAQRKGGLCVGVAPSAFKCLAKSPTCVKEGKETRAEETNLMCLSGKTSLPTLKKQKPKQRKVPTTLSTATKTISRPQTRLPPSLPPHFLSFATPNLNMSQEEILYRTWVDGSADWEA